MNVSKLKIAELKKELKDRGLPTSGNKSELAARLKDALAADGSDSAPHDDDLDAKESELLGEEEEEDEEDAASGEELDTKLLDTSAAAPAPAAPVSKPKKIVINREAAESAQQAAATAIAEAAKVAPPEPEAPAADVTAAGDAPPASKKIKLTTGLSETERLAKRAQKLGAPIEAGKLSSLKILTAEERKAARLAKFAAADAAAATPAAIPAATADAAAPASGKVTAPQKNGTEDLEKLKKRADRFGEAVSAKVLTLEESERLKKRKERFGIVTPEDTKAKRAARFSSSSAPVAPDPATDDKKKQRAARFGMA